MIDSSIIATANETIEIAQKIFNKKCNDYGTSWRVLRIGSVLEQIFIKARRINTIQEVEQRVNGTGDDIASEFLGIINYAIIGIIQNRLPPIEPGKLFIPAHEAIDHYSQIRTTFDKYLLSQNPYYIEEEINALDFKTKSQRILFKVERMEKMNKRYSCSEEGKIVVFGGFLELILWSSLSYPK
jgi:hypothetical protein